MPTNSKVPLRSYTSIFISLLVLVALLLMSVAVLSLSPSREPLKYELITRTVPLAKQTVILTDVVADSAYYRLMGEQLRPILDSLNQDERVCILPVGPDSPLLQVSPWCSVQNRLSWWQMPDHPGAQADQSDQQAYLKAFQGLQAELLSRDQRSQDLWAAKRVELAQTVNRLLWQLPVPQYQDIKGSLGVLLRATRSGENATVPTEVVIYSSMIETPFGSWGDNPSLIPAAPKELNGTTVQVNLFSDSGGGELASWQAKWDPWLMRGEVGSIEWRVLDISSISHQAELAHPIRTTTSHHLLPPVVQKPEFPDVTSVVSGTDTPGDVTNVIR